MANIPDSATDLFISYSNADNIDGWVTVFYDSLIALMQPTTGRQTSVYFDRQDDHQDGEWRTFVLDRVVKSPLFVAVVSRDYLQSAWSVEELRAFLKARGEAARDRVFVVWLDDFSRREFPSLAGFETNG